MQKARVGSLEWEFRRNCLVRRSFVLVFVSWSKEAEQDD